MAFVPTVTICYMLHCTMTGVVWMQLWRGSDDGAWRMAGRRDCGIKTTVVLKQLLHPCTVAPPQRRPMLRCTMTLARQAAVTFRPDFEGAGGKRKAAPTRVNALFYLRSIFDSNVSYPRIMNARITLPTSPLSQSRNFRAECRV